jgi:D-amino-acid dehydrogenase
MRIAVIGAGLAGVTAAWELAKAGHEVTVVDRRNAAASETSFANAGLIAPGHAYVWSSPKAPGVLWRSLFRDDQALRFHLRLDPEMWRWCWKFLRQCTGERARINTGRKVQLCLYSQQVLHEILAETGIACDFAAGGLLYLHRKQQALDAAAANMKILTDNGAALRVVDRDEAAALDPALAPVKEKLAGAIFAPNDESGDAAAFTRGLAERCRGRGVQFHFDTAVTRLEREGDRASRLLTADGEIRADAYVIAAGNGAARLARALGIGVPVYPIKGYSLTVPIEAGHVAPTRGGVDEHYLFAYCRLGDRLRLTAAAEFAGYDTTHKPDDFHTMLAAARDLLPNAGAYDRPSYWACLRPMTPEGTPIIGKTPIKNVFLDVGLGHMGWTMCSGSARILAAAIAGTKPDIDTTGLTLPGL